MQLQDTTLERNQELEAETYYMYRLESPARRWGIAVEQLQPERFSVAVTFCEEGWDVHGVARYWAFESRDLAEARYLELQRLLADVDEAADLPAMLAVLPGVEREDAE